MSIQDTAVTMKEARFDLHELFFSITDLNSTILSGNETFVRISGYHKEELIGHYHNVIRHQDMPKIIFKVFWDYIQAGKPIVAYVKNKTKEGGYYWVLSVVFPLNEKYISIRVKPNTQIFSSIRELYFRLLMAETKLDSKASEELLFELLHNLGYRDYDHFMNEVLLSELLERKELLSQKQVTEDECSIGTSENKEIQSLCETSSELLKKYATWFERIDLFSKIKSEFEEKGEVLRSLARDIVFLSLNASVASYKLETNGETFGVLASDIRTNAKDNDILIEKIHEQTQSLTHSLNDIIFLISYISLQMEMITYFIRELLTNNDTTLYWNIETLLELVSTYNAKLTKQPYQIDKSVKQISVYLEELDQQVMYLGYVQVYGIIESARTADDKLGFGEIFSQLKNLIAKTSEEVLYMKKITDNFLKDNERGFNELEIIQNMLNRFQEQSVTLVQKGV